VLINAQNKYTTPLGTRICARRFNVSYMRAHTEKNHPSGSVLFPANNSLANLFDIFLTAIENDSYFLVYFSRIHLLILHELYTYLTKIYSCFNMNHANSLTDYLTNETAQALNKKTLIINHLVTLIERQSNQAILSRFPALPQHLATNAGFTLLQHDYGADLDLLLEQEEEQAFSDPQAQSVLATMRTSYLNILGKYLAFFRNYMATLEQKPSPFFGYAQTIQRVMQQNLSIPQQKIPASILRALKTINPPLFFYDDDTLRCIKIISELAQRLPKDVASVPWPATVVQDAKTGQVPRDKNGIALSNQPLAYFKDSNGNRTQNSAIGTQLFVNIPTVQDIYSQELLPQPRWLNSYKGIMLMLRACLGDFTAILDPLFNDYPIIDPCLECIITNGAIVGKVIAPSAGTAQSCKSCQTYLKNLRTELQPQQPTLPSGGPAGLPDDTEGAP
jgi:hypothetical protein